MALHTMNSKQIEEYKDWLKKYEPYTYEEFINIPLDSLEYDIGKYKAFIAQKALREAGLLEE